MSKFFFIPLSILMLSGIANKGSAQQYADATGNCGGNTPCNSTIQAAVTAAAAGSTVIVYPGIYNEKVTINKALTLQSTGGASVTTIQYPARGNYEAPVMIPSPTSNVTIGGIANKGFTIIGMDNTNDIAGAGQEAGAVIIGAGTAAMNNINISFNTLTANGEAAVLTYYSGTNYLNNLSITNNLINGKTFEGTAPFAGGPFSDYNAAKPAVAINSGAQNVTFSQNTVSSQTGASGAGNSLVLINSSGSFVNQNTFDGIISGTSASLLSLRGTAATMQCNLLTIANSPGAINLLSTNGTAPYVSASVANSNTFLPATIYYQGSTFTNLAFGTAANSLNPAPGCNIPLASEGISLRASRKDNDLLSAIWETKRDEDRTVFEIQTACDGAAFRTIDKVSGMNGVPEYNHEVPFNETCNNLLVRIKAYHTDGTFAYSNIENIQNQGKSSILVYPNPVQDRLSIETENLAYGSVLLYDYTGRLVLQQNITGTRHNIRLDALKQGIYLVKVRSEKDLIYSGRIVK